MKEDAELIRVIALVYACATDASRWPSALEAIGGLFDGVPCIVNYRDLDGKKGATPHPTGADHDSVRARGERLAAINAFGQVDDGLRSDLIAPGRVLQGDNLISRRAFLGAEDDSDPLRPVGFGGILAVILNVESGRYVGFNVARRLGHEFTRADFARFEELTPHLQRAFQIYAHLENARRHAELSWEALDRLSAGILLVDERAAVHQMNRAAGEVVDAKDGLYVNGGVLSATTHRRTNELHGLIRRTAQASAAGGPSTGDSLAVERPSLLRPYAVLVAPGASLPDILGLRRRALVFVSDPEAPTRTPADALRSLYGLTRAEAKLATLLLEGKSLADAARYLGIKVETARTHAKAIFQKTGCRGQTDLVRLMLRGAAQLRWPD